MATFQFTVNGVPATSNVDPTKTQPKGTFYQFDVNLVIPVAQLTADLISLGQQIYNAIAVATGAVISQFVIFASDASTITVTFYASSPAVIAALLPWIGPIIIASLIALVVVSLFPPGSGGISGPFSWLLPAIGIAAVVGVGAFAYDFLKGGREYRTGVYREVGHAAKGVGRAGVGLVGQAGRAALKTVEYGRSRGEKKREVIAQRRHELKLARVPYERRRKR